MIQLNGTLVVQQRKGRRGVFSVGELISEIGTFKIKDTILDQFEEGRYEGKFLVSKIYSSCYAWNNGVVAEIRATIDEIFLASADESKVDKTPPVEPDPMDETASAVVPVEPPTQAIVTAATGSEPLDASPDSAIIPESAESDGVSTSEVSLFGSELTELIEQRRPVRLDPTIGRIDFRRQRDYLKSMGYTFDAAHQIWLAQ